MSDEVLQLDPKRSALVIQDLQNDVIIEGGAFADSGAPAHATAQNVVGNVADLAAACRAAGVPVIHVWYIVEPGAPGLKQNAPLFQGVKEANALVRGSWGAAPAEGLEPQDGDHVVEKMRMNGFYETRLDILLRGLGADQLIITGAWTNMSIEHTARHGADAGYEVVVASDGTSTTGDEWQNAALNYAMTNVAQGRHLRGDQDAPSARDRPAERPRPAPGVHRRRAGSTPTPARPSPVAQPGLGRGGRPRCRAWAPPRRGARSRPRSARCRAGAGCWPRSARRIMRRWADLMIEHQEDLAALLTTEQGKPLAESRVEIAYAASFLEWFGEEAKRVYGDTIPTYMRDRRIVVAKEPVGVTRRHHAVELPGRDADAQGGARRSAPAARWCSSRPSRRRSRALAVMRLGEEAGLPPGVLSIVTGDAEDAPLIGARDDLQPDRAQARLHRLDRGRQAAHGPVRRAGQEGLARARRQRAVHRLRRRRPRGRRRRRADLQVPQLAARPASRPTGSSCRTAIYDDFLARLHGGRRRGSSWPTASPRTSTSGRSSTCRRIEKVQRHVADARERGADVLLGGERHALGGSSSSRRC